MEALDRYEPLVDDFDAFLAACQRPLPASVRVNPLKATTERVVRAFEDAGVTYERVDWHDGLLRLPEDSVGGTWPAFAGWVHGQEEVSALPATVLDPQPGETVWDAAAAPGSKTGQLAARMADTGLLVANDDNLGRLSALRFNCERLGITNVAVTNQDARHFSFKPFNRGAGEGGEGGERGEAGKGSEVGEAGVTDEADVGAPVTSFDRALVDVPCSCEGTIRKNPDALENWSRGHVESIAGVQKGILRRAIQATDPGGTVVYATCTFAPEENEAVLDHALDAEDCRVVPFECPLDADPGVTEWEGERFDESVANARRFYPHRNDTGGFFTAKLEVGA